MGQNRDREIRFADREVRSSELFLQANAHGFVGRFRNNFRRTLGFPDGVLLAPKSRIQFCRDHTPAGIKRSRLDGPFDRWPRSLKTGLRSGLIAFPFVNVPEHEAFGNWPKAIAVERFLRVLE